MKNSFRCVSGCLFLMAVGLSPQPRQQPRNLVPNGTFEQGQSFPLAWDKLPSEGSVRWLASGGNPGRCIAFTLSRAIAEGPGMLYYSDFFPIENGTKYVFSVDIKSEGPVPRPFVKGYALAPDVHGVIARRPYYQRQRRFPATNKWQTYSVTFTPQVIPAYRGKFDIQWARVMLYAYLKPGKIYFDNVAVRESPPRSDPPPGPEK
jgi:hypothetical protein